MKWCPGISRERAKALADQAGDDRVFVNLAGPSAKYYLANLSDAELVDYVACRRDTLNLPPRMVARLVKLWPAVVADGVRGVAVA